MELCELQAELDAFSHGAPFLLESTIGRQIRIIQACIFGRYFLQNEWSGLALQGK